MKWKLLLSFIYLVLVVEASTRVSATYDEKCPPPEPPRSFRCGDTYRCISHHFVCDGTSDCGDNSDEDHELCGKLLQVSDKVADPHQNKTYTSAASGLLSRGDSTMISKIIITALTSWITVIIYSFIP